MISTAPKGIYNIVQVAPPRITTPTQRGSAWLGDTTSIEISLPTQEEGSNSTATATAAAPHCCCSISRSCFAPTLYPAWVLAYLSSRCWPEVVGGYAAGFSALQQQGRTSTTASKLGSKKKGMELRSVPVVLMTRCSVERNNPFVHLAKGAKQWREHESQELSPHIGWMLALFLEPFSCYFYAHIILGYRWSCAFYRRHIRESLSLKHFFPTNICR